MKVAIVHEWLEHYAGSEHVLEQLLISFPEADLFALVDFVPCAERGFLGGRPVRTSFLQKMPFARRHFRSYLGLMPLAVEQFDLSGYNLVLSSSHAVAKGVITGPGQVHVSYVHTPMRYAWDLQAQYLRESGLERGMRSAYARWLLHRLRMWDVRCAAGVDTFVANSRHVATRIRKVYRRDAVVVPPPVAVSDFLPGGERGDYFLVASRFTPYKRVDIIARAFAAMPHCRLVIVGDGSCANDIAAAVAGAPNITLRKPVSRAELIGLMRQARAFIHAAEEDFGIAMAEAQACGTPVIAYGVGGACDIVADLASAGEPTGVLFHEQTPEAVREAVGAFLRSEGRIGAEACRRNAMRFSEVAFRERLADVVEASLAGATFRVHPQVPGVGLAIQPLAAN